jgi:hypothetical protein
MRTHETEKRNSVSRYTFGKDGKAGEKKKEGKEYTSENRPILRIASPKTTCFVLLK